MHLSLLGWNEQFAAHFQPFASDGFLPARIAVQQKHHYGLLLEGGLEFDGVCTGRLLHETAAPTELPVVGDWVVVRPRPGERMADIHAVLPRQTAFIRRDPGPRPQSQVLAANLDRVFVVVALDGNFNLRRLERLLALAWDSGAEPVVVLNKADLCADLAAVCTEVRAHAVGAEVIAISALAATARDTLAPLLLPGETVAVLGSSGVGKSTLVNQLLGSARQKVGARRDDNSLGRHTTVTRELVPLPGGAVIIDTPGMREVGLWDAGAGIDDAFADIGELVAQCRFTDCRHGNEPGCAVRAAVESGELDAERYRAWLKLGREEAWFQRKENRVAAASAKRVWKQRTISLRKHNRLMRETGDG